MSENAVTVIASMEAREHCRNESDLMERIRKAMRACHGHWMQTDEVEQFRAAVAAAMMESPADERRRIEEAAVYLNRLGAALAATKAGVEVDFAKLLDGVPEDVLPLKKLWEETRS